MIPTVNIEIDHKTNRFGENQIYIRITHRRTFKRKATGIYVPLAQFNKKAKDRKWIRPSFPESSYYNMKLYRLKMEYVRQIDEFLQHNTYFSFDRFFDKPSAEVKRCYFQFARDEQIQLIADDKIGTAKKRRAKHNGFAEFYNNKRLKEFWESKPLYFEEIDPQMLEEYRRWLMSNGKSYNTTIGSLKEIRTIYNQAVKRGVINFADSPFIGSRFSIGAMRVAPKIKLDPKEINRIIELEPETETQAKAKDLFLFSFFTYGMRSADVMLLKWENIKGDRLSYRMMKTENLVPEIILGTHALDILAKYYGKDEVFVFPTFYGYGTKPMTNKIREKSVASVLAVVNKQLKTIARRAKIDKNLSMHIARHSFANIAKENDVSVEKLKEMLCHSDIKITYNYLSSFNNSKLQDAGDSVYGLF